MAMVFFAEEGHGDAFFCVALNIDEQANVFTAFQRSNHVRQCAALVDHFVAERLTQRGHNSVVNQSVIAAPSDDIALSNTLGSRVVRHKLKVSEMTGDGHNSFVGFPFQLQQFFHHLAVNHSDQFFPIDFTCQNHGGFGDHLSEVVVGRPRDPSVFLCREFREGEGQVFSW